MCGACGGPTTASPTPAGGSPDGDLAGLVVERRLELERSTGAYSFLVPPATAKMLLERGETASDLDRNPGGLGRCVGRRRRASSDACCDGSTYRPGLSVLAVGRRSGGDASR